MHRDVLRRKPLNVFFSRLKNQQKSSRLHRDAHSQPARVVHSRFVKESPLRLENAVARTSEAARRGSRCVRGDVHSIFSAALVFVAGSPGEDEHTCVLRLCRNFSRLALKSFPLFEIRSRSPLLPSSPPNGTRALNGSKHFFEGIARRSITAAAAVLYFYRCLSRHSPRRACGSCEKQRTKSECSS